jgi:hypothetical protein
MEISWCVLGSVSAVAVALVEPTVRMGVGPVAECATGASVLIGKPGVVDRNSEEVVARCHVLPERTDPRARLEKVGR